MPIELPGIDLPAAASNWTEQQRDLYRKMDYYLAATSIPRFRQLLLWQKMFKPFKWKPNQGPVLRTVTKVPSPNVRAKFFPNPMSSLPKKDVLQVPEVEEQAQLYRHYFDSLVFQFLPSFTDFLTDHIDAHNKDITEKIARSHDLFLRTAVFEASPHIYLAGSNVLKTDVPYTSGASITEVKTAAFIKSLLTDVTGPLDYKTILRAATVAEFDVGVPPYSGDSLGDGTDGKALKEKYCLICSAEVWMNLQFDPYVQENRPLNMNIVTDVFTGSLGGRIVTKFEQHPLRFDADGNAVAPETRLTGNEGTPLRNLPVPNPNYVKAPYEVAWLVGDEAYKSISVGPPPAPFSSGSMDMDRFKAMDWNGKVTMTRNILVPSLNEENQVIYEPNTRGEYVKLISSAVYGVIPVNRRNVIPILFKRQRTGGDI